GRVAEAIWAGPPWLERPRAHGLSGSGLRTTGRGGGHRTQLCAAGRVGAAYQPTAGRWMSEPGKYFLRPLRGFEPDGQWRNLWRRPLYARLLGIRRRGAEGWRFTRQLDLALTSFPVFS